MMENPIKIDCVEQMLRISVGLLRLKSTTRSVGLTDVPVSMDLFRVCTRHRTVIMEGEKGRPS